MSWIPNIAIDVSLCDQTLCRDEIYRFSNFYYVSQGKFYEIKKLFEMGIHNILHFNKIYYQIYTECLPTLFHIRTNEGRVGHFIVFLNTTLT